MVKQLAKKPSKFDTCILCYSVSQPWMANIAKLFVTFFYQRTPLHVAAWNGRDYTVECLVKKEADISIKDKTGVRETILLVIV